MNKLDELWNNFLSASAPLIGGLAKPVGERKSGACVSCGEISLVTIDAQRVCGGCGTEQGQVFDYGMEWRYYGGDDSKYGSDPSRCGAIIDPYFTELSLRTYIKGGGREQFRKYHKWNSGVYRETRFLEIFVLIDKYIEANELPNKVGDIAKGMYVEIYSKKLIRGKNVDNQLLAIYYYATKLAGIFVTYRDTLEMYEKAHEKKMTKANFSKGSKLFTQLYFAVDPKNALNIGPTTVAEYIDRFHAVIERHCNLTGLPFRPFLEDAIQVAERAVAFGIVTEHSNIAIALGVIYFVSRKEGNESLTCPQIEEICGNISKTSISKVHKALLPWKEALC